MTRVSKKAPTDASAARASIEALAALGLHAGQGVRFRKVAGGRWIVGTVTGREPDGSLGLHDGRGRRRSIAVERVEVQVAGPRGGKVWESLAEHAGQDEQLEMFNL